MATVQPSLVAGLRRFVRPPPAPRPPRRRGRRWPLRAVPDLAGRRPQAPARPRRAAHRLRLPDVLVDALGRRALPPDRLAHAVAGGLRAARRPVGRVPDPDRPRVLHALDRDRQGRRALPEPGRRDRVRARPRGVGPARRRQPGARGPRRRRRGADRQPPRRPACRTRSPRWTTATGSSGSSRRRGRGSAAGARWRPRSAATSTACGPRRWCDERDLRRPDRASLQRPGRRADRARGDARRALPHARHRARGARGVHDRAVVADPHRPGAAHLRRRHAGAARRAVRGARALGRDDARAAVGADRVAGADVHRLDGVHDRGAVLV